MQVFTDKSTVKITSCLDIDLWYKDKIGQEVKVKQSEQVYAWSSVMHPHEHYLVVVNPDTGNYNVLLACDFDNSILVWDDTWD